MIKIYVYINEKDIDAVKRLGEKPWQEVTEAEKLEYQKLMEKLGTSVAGYIRRG